MYGTDAAAVMLYAAVSPDPDVLAFAGDTDHIVGLPMLPEGIRPNAVLIHPDPASPTGAYTRPVGTNVPPVDETVDMVVRCITPGASTDPCEVAAYAALAAVDGKTATVTIRGRVFTVSSWAVGEVTQTFVILADGTFARQLGVIVRCQITRIA